MAENLVNERGDFVVAKGMHSGRRLRDLDTSELQTLANSRTRGKHAEFCKEYAHAYLSLSALARLPAYYPTPPPRPASIHVRGPPRV